MAALGLFELWELTISWSIVFILLVSFFLYSKRKRPANASQERASPRKFFEDFTFVWVLVFLLAFYIVTIDLRSFILFAIGNVYRHPRIHDGSVRGVRHADVNRAGRALPPDSR